MNSVEKELSQEIQRIADSYGIKDIYYGSGYPILTPHIVAIWKDSWSGEGYGYNLWVYPEGAGSGKPRKYFSVTF
jgi:hypothetical protein